MSSTDPKEERGQLAWAAVKDFQSTLELLYKDHFSQVAEYYDSAMTEMLNQHSEHLNKHIKEQTDVDPYKIVCWYGCSLMEKLPIVNVGNNDLPCVTTIVAKATVRTLNAFLYTDSEESFYFNKHQRELLVRMLLNEKGNMKKHGIWQNGLYISFYSALAVIKNNSQSR